MNEEASNARPIDLRRGRSTAGYDFSARDRSAAERDDASDSADRAAEERDNAAMHMFDTAVAVDPATWRSRLLEVCRGAAEDRARAAADRAAARADRIAAADDRRLSALDSLTGAYRRDAGMAELTRLFQYARRTEQSMVIGFLDVDGLKAVNDRYGHAAGDDLLRRVAAAVHKYLDHGDILVRYGGDEFIFSVVGLELDAVQARFEKMQSVLRAHGSGTITCGIAVATGASTVTEVIERADSDLYRRRRSSRETTQVDAAPSALSDKEQHRRANRADSRLALIGGAEMRTVDTRIEKILKDLHSVEPLFQPIVDLSDGVVVGYEALARWPRYPLDDLTAVFTAAASRGVLAELDLACRVAALDRASKSGLTRDHTLFLNLEPTTANGFPDTARARIRAAAEHLDIVLELTERSLLSDPAHVLTLLDQARADGCRIALDDVGSHEDSLILLDFVAPDIIKLDRSLVQQDPNPAAARTIAAIAAHVEATGAVVLAEGIETRAHLDRSTALGASLGQGWLFGRAAPLPDTFSVPVSIQRPNRQPRRQIIGLPPSQVPALPSDVFDCALPNIGRKSLLMALTRQIEQQAFDSDEPLTIMATFQDARLVHGSDSAALRPPGGGQSVRGGVGRRDAGRARARGTRNRSRSGGSLHRTVDHHHRRPTFLRRPDRPRSRRHRPRRRPALRISPHVRSPSRRRGGAIVDAARGTRAYLIDVQRARRPCRGSEPKVGSGPCRTVSTRSGNSAAHLAVTKGFPSKPCASTTATPTTSWHGWQTRECKRPPATGPCCSGTQAQTPGSGSW